MTKKVYISKRVQDAWHMRYSLGNQKLYATYESTGLKTAAFDLPAGFTCPAANICLSYAMPDGRVKLGKDAKFTCYAAKTAAMYPATKRMQSDNLKKVNGFIRDYGIDCTADMIASDIESSGFGIVRIHSSGDMFSNDYTKVWLRVAEQCESVLFFGYTKVYMSYRMLNDVRFPNLAFAFSIGSKQDAWIKDSDVTCTVVTPEYDLYPYNRIRYGVMVENQFCDTFGNRHDVICHDHDNPFAYGVDLHYILNRESFGIALH